MNHAREPPCPTNHESNTAPMPVTGPSGASPRCRSRRPRSRTGTSGRGRSIACCRRICDTSSLRATSSSALKSPFGSFLAKLAPASARCSRVWAGEWEFRIAAQSKPHFHQRLLRFLERTAGPALRVPHGLLHGRSARHGRERVHFIDTLPEVRSPRPEPATDRRPEERERHLEGVGRCVGLSVPLSWPTCTSFSDSRCRILSPAQARNKHKTESAALDARDA